MKQITNKPIKKVGVALNNPLMQHHAAQITNNCDLAYMEWGSGFHHIHPLPPWELREDPRILAWAAEHGEYYGWEEGEGAEWDWRKFDTIAEWATINGMQYAMHSLVSRSPSLQAPPSWLEVLEWKDEHGELEFIPVWRAHVRAVAQHLAQFPLHSVIAANEVFTPSGFLKDDIYFAFGTQARLRQVIATTIKEIRKVLDVPVKICEFDILYGGPKATGMYYEFERLKDKSAKPDWIGCQAHLWLYPEGSTHEGYQKALEMFTAFQAAGYGVAVTEMDVAIGGVTTHEQAAGLFEAQAAIYRDIGRAAHDANIDEFSFWGLVDQYSWRSYTNPYAHPLLYNGHEEKPAYTALVEEW